MLTESSDFSIDELVLYLKETNLFHRIISYSEIYLKTSTPMFER